MSEIFKSMLKTELYELIERKQRKKLPSINSSLVTKQWLIKVYYEEEYCPYYVDVKLRPCPVKPLKQCFIDEIRKILDYNNITLSIDERHTPDLDWCVLVLSTLDENHRFFNMDYYPNDFEKGKSQYRNENSNIDSNQIDEEANLLEGLPVQMFKKSKVLSKNQTLTIKQIQQKNNRHIIDESPDKIEPQNEQIRKFQFTPSQQDMNSKFNTVFNQNSDTKIKPGTQTVGNKIRPLILPKSEQKNIKQIDFSSNISMQTQSNQVMQSQN